MKLETVEIFRDNMKVLINKSDYDKDKHILYKDKDKKLNKEVVKKDKKKINKDKD